MTPHTTISTAQIQHLAKLAQLELTSEEVQKFSVQLTSIVQYIDRIKDVTISSDIKRDFRNINVFREDSNPSVAGEDRDAILLAMPQTKDNMLVVQQILNN